MHNAPTFLM